MKKMILGLIVAAVVVLTGYFIYSWQTGKLARNPNFASGNGRVEATEINIAARLAGKVEKVCVLEGEKVGAGQILVVMQTNVLVANLAQAEARKERAIASEAAAKAKIVSQEATLDKMKADLERSRAVERNDKANYERQKTLLEKDATSKQHYDTAETKWFASRADLDSAEAAIKEVEANIAMAKADAAGARADILSSEAEISRIKADIDDSVLTAPLKGRIQYRVAEPGEVLSAGGRAINMVDLTDVYMTFFLREETAGKVKIGADVRIVLDAAPKYPLPAKVTYVASVAQFTPKTVETSVERQKLMFRVKAHIDRPFLERYIDLIKTGLPGVAWVKLNDSEPWPEELQISPEAQKRADEIQRMLSKEQPAIRSVLRSETVKATDQKLENMERFREAVTKTMSKKETQDLAAEAAETLNETKKARVEERVQAARRADQEKKASVEKTVEVIKLKDENDSQAPVKREVK